MKKHTCESTSKNLAPHPCKAKYRTQMHQLKYWLDVLSRGLVTVGIIVMVLVIARNLQANRSVGKTIASATEADQPQLNQIGSIIDGHWHFAGLPWAVKIEQVSDEEAKHIIDTTLPDEKMNVPSMGESIQVYDILQSLKAETTESGSYTLHRINSESLRAVAFAPKLNPKAIFLIRLVQLIEPGKWNSVELQLTNEPQSQSFEGSHLLPLDPAHNRLATRIDESGNLVAELIDTRLPLSQMQQLWQSAGWEVGKSQGSLASPNDGDSSVTEVSFESGGADEILVCTKDDSIVAAVSQNSSSQNSSAKDSQILLLLRLEK